MKVEESKYLAKCDEFVLARYNFNLDTAKILFAIMYKMNSEHVKPFEIKDSSGNVSLYEFILNFDEIKNLVGIDYNIESDKKSIDIILKDLASKVVIIKDKHITEFPSLIILPIIDNIKKTITFNISARAKRFIFDKFDFRRLTKYGFEHISFCTSKYSIRLYEILLMKANKIKDKENVVFDFTFTIDEIYDILQIGGYKYSQFKERILEKSKNDFLALERSEDVREEYKLFRSFEYVEIFEKRGGKGRKGVEKISFKFELLDKTINSLISKNEKIEKILDNEDWIMIELDLLIQKNREREPYFKTVNLIAVYTLVNQCIERIKREYEVLGTFEQQLIKNSLDMAFNRYVAYKKNPMPFTDFLWGAFERVYQNSEMKKQKPE